MNLIAAWMAATGCCSQSTLVLLLALTFRHATSEASAAGSDSAVGAFPLPQDFDRTFRCDACGQGSAKKPICMSPACSVCGDEKGRQCYSAVDKRHGCCCYPSQMPDQRDFHCLCSVVNGTCFWSCCQVHTYEGQDVKSPICGNGCCKPGNHGEPHKCGRSLYPVRTKGRHRHALCCVSAAYNPDEQRDAGCCKVGVGIDCRAQGRDQPCCLWRSSAHGGQSGPHEPCQATNCSAYQPCDHGVGFDCIGRPGDPKSIGKERCCLPLGVPSVQDACQVAEADCHGRFAPCRSGYGVDCEGGGACCLMPGRPEQGVCRQSRQSCDAYTREQRLRKVMIAGSVVLGLLGLAGTCCVFRQHIRALASHLSRCCCRRGRSRELLLASGAIERVVPLIEHPLRIALVIWCSRYDAGYDVLPRTRRGAESIANAFRSMGYDHVILVPEDKDNVEGATDSGMKAGFRRILQLAEGTRQPLIVIYYCGHAVRIQGSMLWAGIHARPGQMEGHLNVMEICCQLQEVHRPGGPKPFGFQGIIQEAFFVFLPDCCLVPADIEGLCGPSEFTWTLHWRTKPSFYFAYATDPGATAADEADGSELSPFLEGLLADGGMCTAQGLDSLFSAVSAKVEALTRGHQRPWIREVGGKNIHRVSLAPPPGSRAEPSRSCSLLGCRSDSAAASASTDAPPAGHD